VKGMETKNIKEEDIKQLIQDVAMLKEILFYNKNLQDPEGELSEWAKEQLKKARDEPEEDYVSMEEMKKRVLSKK